jgi:TRAP-type C4-dicarboxylate transport system permease small subunit
MTSRHWSKTSPADANVSDKIIDRIVCWNGQVTLWLARVAALVLVVVAVITFWDVIARYIFNSPFTFTVEGTELAMGLIVFLSVGYTTHQDGHIRVDIVTLRLSERVRAMVGVATNAISLGFLTIMVWRLWLRAGVLLAKGDMTQILLVPVWPVAFAMAAGSVFFLTGVAVHMARAVQRLINPDVSAPPAAPRPYSE